MDEIFDLVQKYWWVVGIIILRFVLSNARKKKKAEGETSEPPKRKSQLQEYLEKMRAEISPPEENSSQALPREVPFSSDDEDDDAAFLGHVKVPPVKKNPPRKVKAVDEKKYIINPEPETIPQAEMKTSETNVSSSNISSSSVEKKSFPENLDHLPPMQRAFVFSEIFGSPKGMDV